jgi:ribonuclease D
LTNSPLVADHDALTLALERLENAPLVALDTEFIRERTYRPELCLIQLATPEWCFGVDCLAELDLSPLFEMLAAPRRGWVVHSARQDLEVIWNSGERLPSVLLDTQVAGALVGLPPQLGLQDLLAELLGVRLDKEHTRSDWTRRPLPEAALAYALDDVRHLLPAWRALEERLAELGRIEWFEEDCRRVLAEPLVTEPVAVARRLRGIAELPLEQRAAALALVAWREERASGANRPRRWILADDTLAKIATRLPSTPQELGRLPGVTPSFATRWGDQILAALDARGAWAEAADALGRASRPDKQKLAALKEIVQQRAAALGIHAEVLATRRDLAAVAVGEAPTELREGWRAEQLQLGL